MEISREESTSAPATQDPTVQASAGITNATQQMAAFTSHLAEVANAKSSIGPVQTANGHTLIPVATVSLQAGFGLGFGGGSGGQGENQGQGGGGGGGGRTSSRTIAVVDISDAGVEVRPVLDLSNIILATLALVGLALVTRRSGGGFARRRLLGAIRPG